MKWIMENANWLVPTLIGYLTVTEGLPFLPTKANGVIHMVVELLKKTKWGAASVLLLFLTGCATMNCSSQNSVGDDNRPAINTDAQATQDIRPNTSATIPPR